jgi:hypothetical protein
LETHGFDHVRAEQELSRRDVDEALGHPRRGAQSAHETFAIRDRNGIPDSGAIRERDDRYVGSWCEDGFEARALRQHNGLRSEAAGDHRLALGSP